MKPEAQPIAIAVACGWKYVKRLDMGKHNQWWLEPPKEWNRYTLEFQKSNVQSEQPEEWRANIYGKLPDYLNDLNAMHEAEKYAFEHIMDADQWEQFGRELEKAHPTACVLLSGCDTKKSPIDYFDLATLITGLSASKHAEALLKAIGKWEP